MKSYRETAANLGLIDRHDSQKSLGSKHNFAAMQSREQLESSYLNLNDQEEIVKQLRYKRLSSMEPQY